MLLNEGLMAVASDMAVQICSALDVQPQYWDASMIKVTTYVADAMRVAAVAGVGAGKAGDLRLVSRT